LDDGEDDSPAALVILDVSEEHGEIIHQEEETKMTMEITDGGLSPPTLS